MPNNINIQVHYRVVATANGHGSCLGTAFGPQDDIVYRKLATEREAKSLARILRANFAINPETISVWKQIVHTTTELVKIDD